MDRVIIRISHIMQDRGLKANRGIAEAFAGCLSEVPTCAFAILEWWWPARSVRCANSRRIDFARRGDPRGSSAQEARLAV
jgi:hypothetical protein